MFASANTNHKPKRAFQLLRALACAQTPCEGESIDVRQSDIQDTQVRRPLRKQVQGRGRTVAHPDLMARAGQRCGKRACGIDSIAYKGVLGHTYYVNALDQIIAQVSLSCGETSSI